MTKLSAIALSVNESTQVIESAEGIDGKVNLTKDGRMFVVLSIVDDSNPFKTMRAMRIYTANKKGQWPGATPAQLSAWVGKEIPARFVTEEVVPYEIEERTVKIYTTAVFNHESVATVFRNLGHERLVDYNERIAQEATTTVEMPVVAEVNMVSQG